MRPFCSQRPTRCPHPPARQCGASAVEFVLVALPLLLAGLVVVEISATLMARQVLRLALHEATRAGAVQHGDPQAIHAAFAGALSPLFVPAGTHGSPQARLHAEQAQTQRDTGLPLWRLDVLAPRPEAFEDFGRALPRYGGRIVIAHDYLAEQHARAQTRWPGGRGPRSELTIRQAMVLHLRATYLRRPLTPLVAALLRTLAPLAAPQAREALAAGRLPLVLEAQTVMQSDALRWPPP